ncbi:hypothetical protein FOHLNKBM_3125 [Methylobacterium longum]|nr:hypothetical protein FOHLNKBM_3125 [Methylobacterium longum]
MRLIYLTGRSSKTCSHGLPFGRSVNDSASAPPWRLSTLNSPASYGRRAVIRSTTPQRIAGTFRAHRPIRPRDVDRLISLGVRPEVLQQSTGLRAGYVVWLPRHRFVFEQHLPASHADVGGERALLILVADQIEQAIDIVAWVPATGRLTSWLGRARAVGQVADLPPESQDQMPIWSDPLHWLNAGQRGLVLLGPHPAAGHSTQDDHGSPKARHSDGASYASCPVARGLSLTLPSPQLGAPHDLRRF